MVLERVKDDDLIDEYRITPNLPKSYIRCGKCLQYVRFFVEIRDYPQLQSYCLRSPLFFLLCTSCLLDVIELYYEDNPKATKIFTENCIFANKNLLMALEDYSSSAIFRKFAVQKRYILTPDTHLKPEYKQVLKQPCPAREKARRLERCIPSCNSFDNISFDSFEELYGFLDGKLKEITHYNRRLATPSPTVLRDRYDEMVDETPASIRLAKIAIEKSMTSNLSFRKTETSLFNESAYELGQPATKSRRNSVESFVSDDYQLRMYEDSDSDSVTSHISAFSNKNQNVSSKENSSFDLDISSQIDVANNNQSNQQNVIQSSEELNFSTQDQSIAQQVASQTLVDNSSSSNETHDTPRPRERPTTTTTTTTTYKVVDISHEVIINADESSSSIETQNSEPDIVETLPQRKGRKRKIEPTLAVSQPMAPAPSNIRTNPPPPRTLIQAAKMIHSVQPRSSGG